MPVAALLTGAFQLVASLLRAKKCWRELSLARVYAHPGGQGEGSGTLPVSEEGGDSGRCGSLPPHTVSPAPAPAGSWEREVRMRGPRRED